MSTPSAFTASSGSSGILGVTASSPLESSDGQFPNISLVDEIPVDLGGSGNTSMASYELIAGGITDTDPYQSIPSVSAGYVLTDNGPGALPTFQEAPFSGSYILLATADASNSASIDFTGLSSTYFAYKIIVDSLVAQTNGAALVMRTSSNNGSSYNSGGTDYNYSYLFFRENSDTIGILRGNTGASYIQLQDAVSNSGSFAQNLEITIYNPDVSGFFECTWTFAGLNTTYGNEGIVGQGNRTALDTINAVQFLMTSGNITTGTFKLYGILA